jgi:hypothetical protein
MQWPKTAKSRGGSNHAIFCTSSPPSTVQFTRTPHLAMSLPLAVRRLAPRLAQPCTGSAYAHAPRAVRAQTVLAATRRWASSSTGKAPSMDQVRAQYKMKNRTVMYVQRNGPGRDRQR